MRFGGNVKPMYALGDFLSTLYMLENCGRQKNLYFHIKDNFNYNSYFNLNHVIKKDFKNTDMNVEKIGDQLRDKEYHLSGRTHCIPNFAKYLKQLYGYDHHKSCHLELKKNYNIKKGNFIIGQFDGRSHHRDGIIYNKQYMRKIIFKHTKQEDFYIIGGPDTKKYMGSHYSYKVGKLDFIIQTMLECKLFIGIDSGLSHLAGCMGIPSVIYISHPKKHIYWQHQHQPFPLSNPFGLTCWDVATDLEYYYKGYENNECYGRKDAELKIY